MYLNLPKCKKYCILKEFLTCNRECRVVKYPYNQNSLNKMMIWS